MSSKTGQVQLVLRDEREEARQTFLAIESRRPETMIALGDDIPDEDLPRINLREVREEFNAGVPALASRRLTRLRNWYAPDELANLIGAGPSTMRSYVSKGLPRSKQYWDHDNPPIIVFNQRRRAIHADGINPDIFDTPEKRLAVAQVLATDPPDGWGQYPLMVPRPGELSGGRRPELHLVEGEERAA